MKPNILFITVDQMRGDCLSLLHHPAVETPNLDNLARQGVYFRKAYSATPSCVPARAAIFTGMGQRSHGRVGYEDKVPWRYSRTLPWELASNGYHTQCVGKMHVYPPRNLCGFHHVVLHDGYLYGRDKVETPVNFSWESTDDYVPWLRDKAGAYRDLTDLGLDCNASTVTRPWSLDESLHPTNWVVTQSIDFLRRRDTSKPFFLWMSFVRPHPPLDPPAYYLNQYLHRELPDPPIGTWIQDINEPSDDLNPILRKGKIPSARRKRALAGYYATISHIDEQIGRFMTALTEYGVLNNTLIVFTSDHGDMMGDHDFYRKALPYEGSAKVPFIISDPGGTLGLGRSKSLDDVVELRDIMPTLLDAAGAQIPDTVDGASLLPICRGAQVEHRNYLHGEHAYGGLSNHYITDGHKKYIWYSQTGLEQLFDLDRDPYETTNLVAMEEESDTLDTFRRHLIRELAGREEGYSDGKQLIVGREPINCLESVMGSANP